MHRVLAITACLTVLILSATVSAQATDPTTAVATSRPVDASTPKGSLKALAQALDAGQRQAVLDLLLAQSPAERKVAEATADLAEAAATLRRAAIKAFGEEAARPLGVEAGATPEALGRIDAAKIQLDGDRATVRTDSAEGPPMILVRSDGRWRVPISELSRDVEPADLDRNVAALIDQARLMRQLAAEVSAGKYTTAPDARQALDKRIVQSAFPQTAPASPAPATAVTQPTGH
jgi:hypothetical protein